MRYLCEQLVSLVYVSAQQRVQRNSEQQIQLLIFLLGLNNTIPVSWQSKQLYSAN